MKRFTFDITSPSAGEHQGQYETDEETQSMLSKLDLDGESQCFMVIFFLGLDVGKIRRV